MILRTLVYTEKDLNKNKERHPYCNIKMSGIEQYSQIVRLTEVEKYRKEGWLTYQEMHLPEGDEEAYLLYGEFDPIKETLMFNKPNQLEDGTSLVGRSITSYSTHLGTYGMGGPGFFGLLLDDREYLVYTAWDSSSYVEVNKRIVSCNPKYYDEARPWISTYGEGLSWDELSEILVGAVISEVIDSRGKLVIHAIKDKELLEIKYLRSHPYQEGRKAYKKGKLQDYILFQDKEAILIV